MIVPLLGLATTNGLSQSAVSCFLWLFIVYFCTLPSVTDFAAIPSINRRRIINNQRLWSWRWLWCWCWRWLWPDPKLLHKQYGNLSISQPSNLTSFNWWRFWKIANQRKPQKSLQVSSVFPRLFSASKSRCSWHRHRNRHGRGHSTSVLSIRAMCQKQRKFLNFCYCFVPLSLFLLFLLFHLPILSLPSLDQQMVFDELHAELCIDNCPCQRQIVLLFCCFVVALWATNCPRLLPHNSFAISRWFSGICRSSNRCANL